MNVYDVTWFVRTKLKTYSGIISGVNAPTEEKATENVRMKVWLNEFQDMPISSVLIANCIKTKQFYHL